MKKRLRKKLRKGEFKEMCFRFSVKFKSELTIEEEEAWFREFFDFLKEHSLELLGGWGKESCDGFVFGRRGGVHEEEREMTKKWFEEHGQNLESIVVDELIDAWYGL